jgi:hypothetical protein
MKEIIKDTFIIAFILVLGGGYIYQLVINTVPALNVATYILVGLTTAEGFLAAMALTIIFSVVAASIIKLSR